MGIVYLIKDEDKNSYKIGVTRSSNTEKRLKKLQTGNSSTLSFVTTYYCNFPFRLEKMLHSHFSSKHILNEWYDLSLEDVDDFRNICEQFNQTINILSDNPFFMKNIR